MIMPTEDKVRKSQVYADAVMLNVKLFDTPTRRHETISEVSIKIRRRRFLKSLKKQFNIQ